MPATAAMTFAYPQLPEVSCLSTREKGLVCRQSVDLLFQQHLLAHAERTLADHERIVPLSPDVCSFMKALISAMYDEHRIALEDMTLLPFEAATQSDL